MSTNLQTSNEQHAAIAPAPARHAASEHALAQSVVKAIETAREARRNLDKAEEALLQAWMNAGVSSTGRDSMRSRRVAMIASRILAATEAGR